MEVTLRIVDGIREPKADYLLRVMQTGSPRARILKLADRISNITALGFVHDAVFVKRYLGKPSPTSCPMPNLSTLTCFENCPIWSRIVGVTCDRYKPTRVRRPAPRVGCGLERQARGPTQAGYATCVATSTVPRAYNPEGDRGCARRYRYDRFASLIGSRSRPVGEVPDGEFRACLTASRISPRLHRGWPTVRPIFRECGRLRPCCRATMSGACAPIAD